MVYVNQQSAVTIWDFAADSSLFELSAKKSFSDPHLALSPDGSYLAAMIDPSVVSVWDVRHRRLLYEFRPERAAVRSLAWSDNNKSLAVGVSDGGVALWKLDVIEDELSKVILVKTHR